MRPNHRRSPMVPFPIPELMQFATALDGLSRVKEGTLGEQGGHIIVASYYLQQFIEDSIFKARLRSSVPLARELLVRLNHAAKDFHPEKHIGEIDAYSIRVAYDQFKVALFAELGSFTAYFATPKAGYDINILLESPERLFPPDLLKKVPQAAHDVREAARCLAFEVPTATGFHAFRAVEAVLREYYSHVTGGAAPPKVRSMRVYTRAIRDCRAGDEKVLSALDHLANLHRNPLSHPEDNLTLDEAIDILGLARSIISAMLRAIPEPSEPPVAGLGLLGSMFLPSGLAIPAESDRHRS